VLFGLLAFVGLVLVFKKGGFHGAGLSMAVRGAASYRTILSYIRTKPKRIEDYPTDVIHIR
jgi:hypothetical protein